MCDSTSTIPHKLLRIGDLVKNTLCIHKEVNPYSERCKDCGDKVRIKYEEWKGEYRAMVVCENTCGDINRIVSPQCMDGIMQYAVEVIYDKYGHTDGTLLLCKECKDRVLESAERHGYQVDVRKVVR